MRTYKFKITVSLLALLLIATVTACKDGLPGSDTAAATSTAELASAPKVVESDPVDIAGSENSTTSTTALPAPTTTWEDCEQNAQAPPGQQMGDGTTPVPCARTLPGIDFPEETTPSTRPATSTTESTAPPTTEAPTTTEEPPITLVPEESTSTTKKPAPTSTELAAPPTTSPDPLLSANPNQVMGLLNSANSIAHERNYALGGKNEGGVTCVSGCVLSKPIKGETTREMAEDLLAKLVMSPAALDYNARFVLSDPANPDMTRYQQALVLFTGDADAVNWPVGDIRKASVDAWIVGSWMIGSRATQGVLPTGTLVYNTVIEDGVVKQFPYTTNRPRRYIRFEKDGVSLMFFDSCGNPASMHPVPNVPEIPEPCHDDNPLCGPGETTTTTVCEGECGGKDHTTSPQYNTSVPDGQKHIGDPPITVGPNPEPPVTSPNGCGGPCPTAAPPPTSNPATTQPQSCSYEPGSTTCVTAPPPSVAPPSVVQTTTTHTSMPPPPPS